MEKIEVRLVRLEQAKLEEAESRIEKLFDSSFRLLRADVVGDHIVYFFTRTTVLS